ncbi:MAG: tetratricopeptide repeat protein [Rhodospirillaceae bacterium]
MALADKRGVPVSTNSRAALDRYEQAVELLNGYFLDPMAAIDAALAEDPHFVMGHCFKAAVAVSMAEKAAEPMLREAVAAAEAIGRKANARERGHIAAAHAWLDGDFAAAADRYGRVLEDHPRDILALQAAHLADFYLGRSTMLRDRVARVLPEWDGDVPGRGFVLGMHAFGLEEMQLYDRAEEAGRRALDANPRDPWAVHAVAHVMEMQGRVAEGIAWLAGRETDWSPDNMFAYHNWWHRALYHLDRDQHDQALEIYDRQIRPRPSTAAIEMVDASALLWRLHLRGAGVGDRWKELADSWEPMAEDGYYAFNDGHAMMAFAADGRRAAADRLLATLARRADGAGTNAMMTREVGLPLCRALDAFGRGDHAAAADLLLPLPPIAGRFGGSHAQRDVIHLTLTEAALRAGRLGLARSLAAERCDLKPSSAFNWRVMSRAMKAAGDNLGAAAAARRAADV